jgi:hypothetical protein
MEGVPVDMDTEIESLRSSLLSKERPEVIWEGKAAQVDSLLVHAYDDGW